MRKELHDQRWDFVLLQDGETFIIKVMFMGLCDHFRSFVLLPDEVPANGDYETLKVLSEHIRNNYDLYKNRQIQI